MNIHFEYLFFFISIFEYIPITSWYPYIHIPENWFVILSFHIYSSSPFYPYLTRSLRPIQLTKFIPSHFLSIFLFPFRYRPLLIVPSIQIRFTENVFQFKVFLFVSSPFVSLARFYPGAVDLSRLVSGWRQGWHKILTRTRSMPNRSVCYVPQSSSPARNNNKNSKCHRKRIKDIITHNHIPHGPGTCGMCWFSFHSAVCL